MTAILEKSDTFPNSESKAYIRSFYEFLTACKFQTPPCEKCEKKARFLIVYVQQADERSPEMGCIEFIRICLDHLTPDVGLCEDLEGDVDVIDLENKVNFELFSADEIRAVRKQYETQLDYHVAFTELLKFAKMSIDYDQKTSAHHDHITQRIAMLAECKIDERECEIWPHYYQILTKLFQCCCWKNHECWQLGCGHLARNADKYFSKYSIELYERFYHWCIKQKVVDCVDIIKYMFSDTYYWDDEKRDVLPDVPTKNITIDYSKKAIKELKEYAKLCLENDQKHGLEFLKEYRDAVEQKVNAKDLKEDYDNYSKNMEIRTKTLQECKDDIQTLFYCCKSCTFDEKESDWGSPQSTIPCTAADCWHEPCKKCKTQIFKIFSPESVSFYHEFSNTLLKSIDIEFNRYEIWKKFGKIALCLRIIDDIFGEHWVDERGFRFAKPPF